MAMAAHVRFSAKVTCVVSDFGAEDGKLRLASNDLFRRCHSPLSASMPVNRSKVWGCDAVREVPIPIPHIAFDCD